MSRRDTSPWKLGGLRPGTLLRRTWNEMTADDAYDSAAALGYYFLFALFPMLMFLVSLVAEFSSQRLIDTVLIYISRTMPGGAAKLLSDEMVNILKAAKGGLLTFGIFATIWSASSGVASIMDGLNRAYEVKETRSFPRRRLLAILLTLSLAALTILGAGLLVVSDQVGKMFYQHIHVEWARTIGVLLGTCFGLGSMFVGLELMYYFGPNVENPRWYWATPGSAIGVLIFVAASFGFSEYVRWSGSYETATYGSLGGVMLLMLWFFILGLAIVIGGEVNSEIAKAALARGNRSAPHAGQEQAKGPEKGKP